MSIAQHLYKPIGLVFQYSAVSLCTSHFGGFGDIARISQTYRSVTRDYGEITEILRGTLHKELHNLIGLCISLSADCSWCFAPTSKPVVNQCGQKRNSTCLLVLAKCG